MPSSSLAQDLLALREARGLSIDEIQQQTRVPADIIRRLEAGTLLDDSRYSEVYLNAFLKSYAQAVEVPSGAVVTAIAESKRDMYSGSLRQYLPEGAVSAPSAADASEPEPPPVEDVQSPDRAEQTRRPAPSTPTGAPPAVAALANAPAPEATKKPAPMTTRAPSRQTRGQKTSKPIDKSWGTILGIAGGAILVIGAVLFLLFRDDTPEDQAFVPVVRDTTTVVAPVQPEEEEVAAVQAPQLTLPISVTLVAQEALAGFRVTEAPDIRRPYWLEGGTEQTFQSSEEVIIWGGQVGESYGLMEGARLRIQGVEWSPQNGVLRITPANGQALLDSLVRTGSQGATEPAPSTVPPAVQPEQPTADR